MKLSNYHVARILMIVVIIASVILGNMRSMNQETQKILEIFEVGEDKDGLSARNDLLDRCNDSMNMLSLADRYNYSSDPVIELNDISAEMKMLLSQASLKNINKLAGLNNELTNIFDSVYSELKTKISKETDQKLLTGLYDDFHSTGNILSRSDYNQAALEYNELAQSFPNNILSLFNNLLRQEKPQKLDFLSEPL